MKIKIILLLSFAFVSTYSIAQMETMKLLKNQQEENLAQKIDNRPSLAIPSVMAQKKIEQPNWANLTKNRKKRTSQQSILHTQSRKKITTNRSIKQNKMLNKSALPFLKSASHY